MPDNEVGGRVAVADRMEITARSGDKILVDISDEACTKFGFKHNDRFRCKGSHEHLGGGTVMGVAKGVSPATDELVLWAILDHNSGLATFYSDNEIVDMEKSDTQPPEWKQVTTKSGDKILVDISSAACEPFGFNPGDRVQGKGEARRLGEGTVVGVGYGTGCGDRSTLVMWVILDRDDGRAIYHIQPGKVLEKI